MKIKRLFLWLLLATMSFAAISQEVDIETIKKVAKNCYFQQKNLFDKTIIEYNDINIINVDLYSHNNTPSVYAVNFEKGGFVLVSAQNLMVPIIGFNTDENVVFNIEDRGPEFESYFNDYLQQIDYLVSTRATQSEEVENQWKAMSTDDINSLISNVRDRVQVGPLLPTLWNQDHPYNFYAPETTVVGAPGGKCYAGCVATAMSVLMHYWGWPNQGVGQYSYYSNPCGVVLTANFGETTYDYESMPKALTTTFPDKSIHEVAQLQSHAGIAVSMGYCVDGCTSSSNGDGSSGAYSQNVPPALKTYFRFPNAQLFNKEQNSANWENMLKEQFDNGYPVYYAGSGYNSGGHAWNCDGYRTVNGTNYFHHNFNWGGWLNDWYTETGLASPGFPTSHRFVGNVYPPADQYPTFAEGFRELTEKFGRISDGSGPVLNYQPNTEASWLINPQSEFDSVKNITLEWEQFELGAQDKIEIYDGGDENATLVGTYSGTTIPEKFTSTGNKLFIKFQSTSSNPGFTFNYLAKEHKFCSGNTTINDSIGNISSNPPDKYYSPGVTCLWQVKPKNLQYGLTVSFDYVDTYDENDFVEIYDFETQEIMTFYGNETPTEVFTFSPKGIIVKFKSDNINTVGHGFSLKYEPILSVNDYYIGEITAYPNPTKDNLTIKFNNKNDNINIEMYNITGSVVFKDQFNTKGMYEKNINVSSFPTGVYIIKINSDQGVATKKIIVE